VSIFYKTTNKNQKLNKNKNIKMLLPFFLVSLSSYATALRLVQQGKTNTMGG
jgi:hypothetical protein